jgi:hypothetical protein
MSHPFDARVAAAQKTRDHFWGKEFTWGKRDCAQMVAWHCRAMGVPVKQAAKAGSYHSLVGAQRALKRLGYETLADMADAHFERIAPAQAWPGDLIELPAEDRNPLGCLTVALTNGRVLGYVDGGLGAAVLQPSEYVAAWRVTSTPAGGGDREGT